MRRILDYVGLALALLLIPKVATADTLAEIKQRKQLRVGLQQGYIPFNMRKPDGEWIGFEVDMANKFAKELGAIPSFVETKWDGIIPALHAKKFDVIIYGMTITPERAKAVLFSDGYFSAGLKALLSKKAAPRIKKLSDLNTPTSNIVVQLATTGDFFAAANLKNANITKMDSEADAANAVLLGKFDAFIGDGPYVRLFTNQHKEKVAQLTEELTSDSLGVAARKSDVTLINAFNDFLKKWKSTDDYEKTVDHYFEKMAWLKSFPNLK